MFKLLTFLSVCGLVLLALKNFTASGGSERDSYDSGSDYEIDDIDIE